MKSKKEFSPIEWAKKENAPQKSEVNNPTPTATQGGWAPTDEYEHAREVVKRLVCAGTCISDDYADWFHLGAALANGLGESGRDLYHQLSSMSSKYDYAECDKKYDNCLRTGNGSITFATFFQMAKEAGVDIRMTRRETSPYAPYADTHSHTEKNEKDNSLNINDNNISIISMDTCGAAESADGAEAISFQSTFSDKILPMKYDTEIIKQTVRELGMNQRTAERYIGDFVNKHHIAERITTGHYCKTNLRK